MIEGPRPIKTGEFESLKELLADVFRPGMTDEYPNLFNGQNNENLFVCVDEGKCVSHVGLKLYDALIYGCMVRIGCIGAVGTNPEYRKQGFASECLDMAIEAAKEQRRGCTSTRNLPVQIGD